jgi:hypothetical protein
LAEYVPLLPLWASLCLGIVLLLAIKLDWPEGRADLLLILVGGGFVAAALFGSSPTRVRQFIGDATADSP